jgi:hypothetical protein
LLRADGKIFPTAMIAGDVSMPDQRAILCWSQGEERLVIETRFVAEGTNFAWVVPLPAAPRVEAASVGAFRTLEHLTRPELRHRVAPVWRWILGLGTVIWLVATVRPTGRLEAGDVLATAALVAALGAGNWRHAMWALLAGSLLLGVVALCRRGCWHSGLNVIAIAVFLTLASGYFSRSLSKASADVSRPMNTIHVISRQTAGVYDVTVISAREARALPVWLLENGYALTPGSVPILERYASEGWVFAAAKVRRDAAAGADTPHPLSFTFPAPEPVYPLRLTGSSGEPLDVELYVFGQDRADASGFSVEDCRRLFRESQPGGRVYWPRRGMMRHPLLASWTMNCIVMTTLRGTLSPIQLEQDAAIHWRPFQEARRVVYSRAGARTMAMNAGIAAMACGLIGLWLAGTRWSRLRILPWMPGGAVVLGVIAGGAMLACLEVVAIRIERNPHSRSHHVQLQAWAEASALLDREPGMDLTQLRKQLAEVVTRGYTNSWSGSGSQITTFTNPFTGTAMIEVDSPGNYILREHSGRIEFVAFDAEGGELVMNLDGAGEEVKPGTPP